MDQGIIYSDWMENKDCEKTLFYATECIKFNRNDK